MTNEMRVAHQHLGNISDPVDPVALEIPSIEIAALGLTGFNAGQSRTALGIAVNFPQFRYNDTYQFQNTFTWVRETMRSRAGRTSAMSRSRAGSCRR